MYDHNTYEDPNRARAITDAVEHLGFFGAISDADILILEEALGNAYDAGYDDAMDGLRTATDAADELELSRQMVNKIAKRDDLGRQVGRDRIFSNREMLRIRKRKSRPGPEPATKGEPTT